MEWYRHSKNQDGTITVPDNWIFINYYEALSLLFRIENALRMFVYIVLKDELGEAWETLEISSDEKGKMTISALAKQRIEQNRDFGYLGYPINSPLMYLTSGELVRIIIHDSYWKHFKPYFMAAKNVVTLKLQEIGNIRNALAHFRPIKPDDTEVVKQNANQVLIVVEKTLVDIVRCDQVIPTNTEEEWYSTLRSVGTQEAQLLFSQSVDNKWVRVTMCYYPPILRQAPLGSASWKSYRTINIRALDVLQSYHGLASSVIFLSEEIPYMLMPQDFKPKFQKRLAFTFSRKTLAEKYDELKKQFEQVVKQISSETELLSEDQLARGRILNCCTISAKRTGSDDQPFWDWNQSSLRTPVQAEYPAEFWRPLDASDPNFISNTEKYPWMPASVSETEFPL